MNKKPRPLALFDTLDITLKFNPWISEAFKTCVDIENVKW